MLTTMYSEEHRYPQQALRSFESQPVSSHASVPRAVVDRLANVMLDQVECGLITCRADGTLIHANRAARREIDLGRILSLANQQLRCHGDVTQAELAAALHDAAVRQRSRMLVLGTDAEHLSAVAMPIQVDALGMPAALLMVGRRSVCSPLALEMIALRHNLTLAERRVLRALIASQSARDIADAHGVAMSTIRSQIQSIRDKVGVRSIEELLMRAAQVPPVSSWHELRN
ncbi:LuxR C-terminal-related transcriptional regulator [Pelomonas sp. KK5]|uniref:helix-turn-helix transcriptional regulator n=1 Tax=Pelomonas sp. KK5 TaxID=1855730 RepID=UPI00097C4D34|nr:LuxR C-terminal-related transcriptional regulator [Pelomonas sp. KK5]